MPIWAIILLLILFLVCVMVNKIKLLYQIFTGTDQNDTANATQHKNTSLCITSGCSLPKEHHHWCKVCYELEKTSPCDLCGSPAAAIPNAGVLCDLCYQRILVQNQREHQHHKKHKDDKLDNELDSSLDDELKSNV